MTHKIKSESEEITLSFFKEIRIQPSKTIKHAIPKDKISEIDQIIHSIVTYDAFVQEIVEKVGKGAINLKQVERILQDPDYLSISESYDYFKENLHRTKTQSDQLLTQYPLVSMLWNNHGVLLLYLAEWEEAEKAFQRGLKLDSANTYILFNQGTMHLIQDNNLAARKVFTSLVEYNPRDGDAWGHLGMINLISNRYTEAESALKKAVEFQPTNHEFWLCLGSAQMKQLRLAEATEAFKKSLQISPQHNPSWITLGSILMQQDREAEAETLFQTVLDTNPTNAYSWLLLGLMAKEHGKLEESIERFKNAIKHYSAFLEDWKFHYEPYLQKETIQAEMSATSMVRSLHILAWTQLTDIYLEQKMLDEAEVAINEVLTIDPQNVVNLANMGLLRKEEGNFLSAIEAFETALSYAGSDWPYRDLVRKHLQECHDQLTE